eukprot:scaffold886_cov17-Tisochrysis_lutea.AAC.1
MLWISSPFPLTRSPGPVAQSHDVIRTSSTDAEPECDAGKYPLCGCLGEGLPYPMLRGPSWVLNGYCNGMCFFSSRRFPPETQ